MKGAGVRPVRILLPVDLARRVDDAIDSNLGGFRDHHSLVAAAIDAYLLDLVYANEGQDLMPAANEVNSPAPSVAVAEEMPIVDVVERGVSVVDTSSVLLDAPLLGLHNRDWPSLWALGVLAAMTKEGIVPWRAFMVEVTSRAWEVAEQIAAASGGEGRKATALLPTNQAKAQSAESAFQSFAVASVGRRADADGRFSVSGPLPLWRAIGFTTKGNELYVGLTDRGWDLLEQMSGLPPTTPHAPAAASAFLHYLGAHSEADSWGFQTMLTLLVESPTRDQYLSAFSSARTWTGSVGSSTAQGYLARGREWGLVEPKISAGRYHLTGFGKEIANA